MLKYINLTFAFVSSAVAMVVMVFFTAYNNTEMVHPDGRGYQDAPLVRDIVTVNDDKLLLLQNKVDILLEKQQELLNQNYLLEHRITILENDITQSTAQSNTIDNDDNQQISTETSEQEEQELAMASDDISHDFSELANQVQFEDYDANWNAQMQKSLNEIENRLYEFNLDSTTITHSQCGSQSCLVEFTHDKAVNTTLIAGLLSAQGAREVVLKEVEEGDVNKTLVVYLR